METNRTTQNTEADRRIVNPFASIDLKGAYRVAGSVEVNIQTASDLARAGISTTYSQIEATWGSEGVTEYKKARSDFEATHPGVIRLV